MHDTERLRERALALPAACLVLFSPPLLTMFGRPATLAGVPLSYLYIFGTWLALILVGLQLARRLTRAVDTGTARGAGTEDEG